MNPMNYYKHVKIHSSVKPFFCCVCGYRAVRKDNVQQHVRKVHKIETPGDQHVGKVRQMNILFAGENRS
jgi:hypothetical protein